jgi:hypothetical protein
MLKVNFLHICDTAIIDKLTGKVSIVGIFENINASSFPAIHPTMSVVAGFEADPGSYDIEIIFLDEKEEIVKIPAKITIGTNRKGNWIQNIVGYQIPREATQKIIIKSNGEKIHEGYLTINNK